MLNEPRRYRKEYAGFLRKRLVLAKSIRVVFDSSGGATGVILKQVFRGIPNINAFYINPTKDGEFSRHSPNPLAPRAMEPLAREVRHRRADAGIIFDADGDRMFAVDENGVLLEPDIVAYFLAAYLKPGTIVYDTNTGFLIRRDLRRYLKTKMKEERVGHYFIKKTMRKINADMGVERSGHYYFKDFFFCDSGLFAAVSFLSALSALPYRLSDFVEFIAPVFRSPETNFKISQSPYSVIRAVERAFSSAHPTRVSYRDGLRMEFKDWWFSVRQSNTEPLIRLNLEASSKKELKKKNARISGLLRKFSAERA